MPNEQTSVPLFTAGEVLTAANMNISAGTGVPVFSNSTTRDASFGGAGEKVLAEGQLCYLSDTNITQYYSGSSWLPVGAASGLTLVKTQTIGSGVGSVVVSDAFSATYDNYKISISSGVSSATCNLETTLGASAASYGGSMLYYALGSSPTSPGVASALGSKTSSFSWAGAGTTNALNYNIELQNPFLAKYTFLQSPWNTDANAGTFIGVHSLATSYSAFTITPSTGTLTGGTIRVYGYQNS
jgi:hypothetical protein